ncbi:MAG: hypothetical protein U0990_08820 [Candidatus Nanopelagicales bacterium]|nr:hypothetical protein [Candidatus Nanopelagicales bacterium]MDZ4250179.1 hypothetical protein [Candidatus Nanopelagicales bacterium]
MTPPKSVLIMNFGPRRARTVELANALAAAGVETTLLCNVPTTWMLPREVALDRAVRIELLADYLQEHPWERLRHQLAMVLRRGAEVYRFGLLGGVVRRGSRGGQAVVDRVELTARPLLLASSAMRCLGENSIPDVDAVVAANEASVPAADRWGRRHPGRTVLVARGVTATLRELGVDPIVD